MQRYPVHLQWTAKTFHWTIISRPWLSKCHSWQWHKTFEWTKAKIFSSVFLKEKKINECKWENKALDVGAESGEFHRKTQLYFTVFALPTCPAGSQAVTRSALMDWNCGNVRTSTHDNHKEQIRSPWLLSVIRSVCDAGRYHLSILLEGFHQQSVVANLVCFIALKRTLIP